MYIKLAQQLPEYGHESFQALVCTCTCMYTYVRMYIHHCVHVRMCKHAPEKLSSFHYCLDGSAV